MFRLRFGFDIFIGQEKFASEDVSASPWRRHPPATARIRPEGEAVSNVRVSNPRLKGRDVLQEKFVVVDLETTGLSPRNNAIIEIGAVKFEAGAAKYATKEALIDPEVDIPGVITGINGISNEMVEGCGVIEEELPHFIEFFGDLPLAIFNAPFDMGFLRHNALKIGAAIDNPVIDVLPLSRKAFPALPNHKLTTLKAHFGIRVDQSHRALVDCRTTLSVYGECIKKLFGRGAFLGR